MLHCSERTESANTGRKHLQLDAVSRRLQVLFVSRNIGTTILRGTTNVLPWSHASAMASVDELSGDSIAQAFHECLPPT